MLTYTFPCIHTPPPITQCTVRVVRNDCMEMLINSLLFTYSTILWYVVFLNISRYRMATGQYLLIVQIYFSTVWMFISISYVHIVSTVWAGKLCTLVFFLSKTPSSAFHCDGPAFVIRRETGSSWRIRLRYIGQPIPSFIALVPKWFAPYQLLQEGSLQFFNCLSFTLVWRRSDCAFSSENRLLPDSCCC